MVKRLVLLTLFIISFGDIHSQILKGNYTNLKNRKGEINAEYKIIKGDTVFNGQFEFVIKDDIKNGHRFVKETYTGKYDKGLKQGKWEYDEYDYEYNIYDIDEGKVRLVYWGTKEITKAIYHNGIPEGVWSYAFFDVDSLSKQTLDKVGSLHFENGKPNGNFAFKSLSQPKYEVDGNFDSLSRLDGKWTLRYFLDSIEIIETRLYNDGFLLELIKREKDSVKAIDSVIFEMVKMKLDAGNVPKAKGVFNILFDDGYLSESTKLRSQSEGNRLLEMTYDKFFWADLGRGALTGAVHDFYPGTGRFEYEVEEAFINNLDQMKIDLIEIVDRSDDILNNSKFFINYHQSDFLSKSQVLLLHQKNKANGILVMLNSRQDSLYRNIDQDIYFGDIFEYYIEPSDTLYYQYDEEVKSFEVKDFNSQDLSPFYKLQSSIGQLNDSNKNTVDEVKVELENILQIQLLTSLEQDIQFSYKGIEKSFLTENASLTKEVFKNSIAPWFSGKMIQYSEISDLDSKEKEGRFVLGVLEEIKDSKKDLVKIENRIGEIDTAYTELVFDPYTYSADIKKRLKKRIYDEVAIRYFEHLKNELINMRHADELKSKIDEITALQQKLLSLSSQNTRSLEKKLRKDTDFDSIRKWLELE